MSTTDYKARDNLKAIFNFYNDRCKVKRDAELIQKEDDINIAAEACLAIKEIMNPKSVVTATAINDFKDNSIEKYLEFSFNRWSAEINNLEDLENPDLEDNVPVSHINSLADLKKEQLAKTRKAAKNYITLAKATFS